MAEKKILVIDDDTELLELLRITLSREGFSVVTVETGKTALEQLLTYKPEMVILDLMLPDVDGLEICRRIREQKEFRKIPIIMLSARKTVDDRVTGLDEGADVYFPKPFDEKELLAQIRSTFRRLETVSSIIHRGPFMLNPQYNQITVNDKEISGLSNREFNILYTLLHAAPAAVSRGDLYKKIWEEGEYPDTTRRIDMMVQRLRSKLGKEGATCIKTVEGVGYRFEESDH